MKTNGLLGGMSGEDALIHTADGDHFRDAIAAASASRGLGSVRVPARELESRVASAVGRPAEALRQVLKETGRELGPPWTADQKSAALLAWLLLRNGAATRRAARG